MRPEVIADVVAQAIADTIAPLVQRIAAVERSTAALADPALLADVSRRVDAVLADGHAAALDMTSTLAGLDARIAGIEAREPVAGPPGPAGPPGVDGKDGAPGLRYCGVYVDGKAYDVGDGVTWAGSVWHCNAPTSSRPGESSKVWTLIVKRGRDGRDAATVGR
jgi:hypothetical protein